MKWGRKKKQSISGSSRPFAISEVMPWMSKFKQMGIDSGRGDREMKQKGKGNSISGNSVSDAGKFYGGDNDGGAFWRLSFGEEKEEFCSVRYVSDDDGVRFQQPSCRNCTLNAAGRVNGKVDAYSEKFNVVAQGKISRKFTQNVEVSPCVREKVAAEIRTPRLRVDKEKKSRNGNRRVFEEKQVEFEERKDCCIAPLNSRDRYLSKLEEFAAENGSNIVTEWQKLKERKIKELKSRNEEQRKSLYISRELQRKTPKQNTKVRAFSPRIASRAEICKIKAFEDMKRAKLKTKKKAKEKTVEGFRGLESFAVAKYSYDPQHDFRESMIEMIKERRIRKPEELKELLACYLTLNSNEYHDLIIKLFKQVWFDMSRACFELETELDK